MLKFQFTYKVYSSFGNIGRKIFSNSDGKLPRYFCEVTGNNLIVQKLISLAASFCETVRIIF